MKKAFLLLTFVFALCFSAGAQTITKERPYNWAIGLRASLNPAVTAKHYFDANNSIDLDLGIIDIFFKMEKIIFFE